VLDNSPRSGHRPVPRINKDYIYLTRVLRRDGNYWFELENKAATKIRVTRLLSKLGVDPDNMLIIMHQNMVEQFTVLPPEEKLRMVEAAVGLESYREDVLMAQRKLSRILSQEESVSKLLESAEQTLTYWREQYDRFQEKKQLRIKRQFLERELAWAEAAKMEKKLDDVKKRIREKQYKTQEIADQMETTSAELNRFQREIERSRTEWKRLLENRIAHEREKARYESRLSTVDQTIEEMRSWAEISQKEMTGFYESLKSVGLGNQKSRNPKAPEATLTEVKSACEDFGKTWVQRFALKTEDLERSIEDFKQNLQDVEAQITGIREKTDHLDSEIDGMHDAIIDHKISQALMEYKKEELAKAVAELDKELRLSLRSLDEAVKRAKETGPQLVPMKSTAEILDEIRVTDGHLAALTDVSEDIERMYEKYSQLYLELKEKAHQVAENREKALEEVETRMDAWKKVIKNLLEHVNLQYQQLLWNAQAVGDVQLVNGREIEAAGLGILVGFKGGKPVPLNAYTQSGGERTTATMAFLLALQQHVQSPFRAVDEYDIHMDPKNREMIADILVSSVRGTGTQYLAITPSQITFSERDVHIVTVQNIEGTSAVSEVT
jgi:chromosome segregation ATPase